MTNQDFTKWKSYSQTKQANRFRSARIALGLTQEELGERLKGQGIIKGGANTVACWEQARHKIPVLVFELVKDGFAERGRS